MLNDLKIQGYLGRDPELSEVNGQKGTFKKVTFSVGVGRDFGDETDWFRCVLIGKRAEVIDKYFRKGSEIIVSGRMESYRPKKDPDRIVWNVLVTDFWFTRNGTGGGNAGANRNEPAPDDFEQVEEDVPF